jgi:hypothetical protein
VDELARGRLLERHLDGGAHWHLVGRRVREIDRNAGERLVKRQEIVTSMTTGA